MLLQTSRLFGGEVGAAFVQTLMRVREQIHSDLIGLHLDSLGGQTADGLAAYRNAIGAHTSDLAVATTRATSLLGSAVAKQAAVLPKRRFPGGGDRLRLRPNRQRF